MLKQHPSSTLAALFRERLNKAETCVGTFAKTCDPMVVEAIVAGGLDFVILDMEHGPVGYETMHALILAAEAHGRPAVVRVPDNSETAIGHALDLGAAGVQVLQVNNREEARRLVRSAKFSPQGMRGACRFVRAAAYSMMDGQAYFRSANEALVVIHVEGKEGLNNLHAIVTEPGIDVVFLGPYDLSQSMGVPGQIEHEQVQQAMRDAVQQCRRHQVAVGTFVEDAASAQRWRDAGVCYLAYGVDVGLIANTCSSIKQAVCPNTPKVR